MSQRVKSVIRIAELIDHQKEVIEMQVLQIQKRLHHEESQLADLENKLEDTIDTFEEDMKDGSMLTSQEVAYLYGTSSFLFSRIEQKSHEIIKIDKELKAQEAILLEAYKKKKAFDLFKNKMVVKEKNEDERLEQKSLDYSNLVNRLRR
jgi:flagellar export protein FliJ